MEEIWQEHPYFTNYKISNHGSVMNKVTGRRLVPSVNAQGILKISLRKGDVLLTRSIAVMVADLYLPPSDNEAFNSIIQLDGNRKNCRADNLMRRPRWFAILYHRQFAPERYTWYKRIPWGVIDQATGEEFPSIIDAAVKYGLLFERVYLSAANQGEESVFPTWQRFVRE